MLARVVIGVTGHRSFPANSFLDRSVDAVLDEIELRASQEGERPVPLTVLSPLAEGADRLVAGRVLAREGAELEVVLPFPEDEYARDFETPRSRAEFAGLLARARSLQQLSPSPTRAEAYARAGRYVVDHCDILIAIWDGKPAEGTGGTAEIVCYAREKGRALAWIDPVAANLVRIDGSFGTRI